jgi:hypothetical protein
MGGETAVHLVQGPSVGAKDGGRTAVHLEQGPSEGATIGGRTADTNVNANTADAKHKPNHPE